MMKLLAMLCAVLGATPSVQAKELDFVHLPPAVQQAFAQLMSKRLPTYHEMQATYLEVLEEVVAEHSPATHRPLFEVLPESALTRLHETAKAIQNSSHPELDTDFARNRSAQTVEGFFVEMQSIMELLDAAATLEETQTTPYERGAAIRTIQGLVWGTDGSFGNGPNEIALWVKNTQRGDGCVLVLSLQTDATGETPIAGTEIAGEICD